MSDRKRCSHCHTMNDVIPFGRPLCRECGHNYMLARMECDCSRCVSMWDDKAKRFGEAVRSLAERHGKSLVMNVDWSSLLCVIASLQLALRHPDMPKLTRKHVRSFVDGLLLMIDAAEPRLAALLREGDMPEHDVPIPDTMPKGDAP